MSKLQRMGGQDCTYYVKKRCTRTKSHEESEAARCSLLEARRQVGAHTLDRLDRLKRLADPGDREVARRHVIRKNLDLDKVAQNIELLARRRVLTRGFFMLGFPTETAEEMRATIDFACRSPLHLALFFTVAPFKGTELHRLYEEAGLHPPSLRTIDYEYYGAPFNGSDVPDWKFRLLYRYAYARFYSLPGRTWRMMRDRPYHGDLPRRVLNILRNVSSFRRLRE